MARKSGKVLQKHVLVVLRGIHEIVPSLGGDEREDLFLVLVGLLEHLQLQNGETRNAQFAAVEAELAAAFKKAAHTHA